MRKNRQKLSSYQWKRDFRFTELIKLDLYIIENKEFERYD
jgi:hypothetical protein